MDGGGRKLELSPRLRLLADWVEQGAALTDVGTDHGYLPVWLTSQGRLRSAIACDLRQGPLNRGRETARHFGVESRIAFRLCNGLSGVKPEETDTIVMAGMGAGTMISILLAAPWTADGRHRLLLQPQSHPEELRAFLTAHGYAIGRERLVLDRGTLYPVMEVLSGVQDLSLGRLWGGVQVTEDPLGNRYLIEQILRHQTAVAGLNRAESPEAGKKADGLREVLNALMELREEWRHANGG